MKRVLLFLLFILIPSLALAGDITRDKVTARDHVVLENTTTPGNAPTGASRVYVDSADDTLRLKDDTGAVSDFVHVPIAQTTGFVHKNGTADYTAILSNLNASVDPGTSDDSVAGYAVGSVWVNTTADKVFRCVDSTTSAAVWIDIGAGATGGDPDQNIFETMSDGTNNAVADTVTDTFTFNGFGDVAVEVTPGTDTITIGNSARIQNHNYVINPEGVITQRLNSAQTSASAPTNADFNKAKFDHWILLAEGTDAADWSQSVGGTLGSLTAMKGDAETANLQFGLVQFLNGNQTSQFVGGAASTGFALSAYVKTDTTEIANARMALLCWESTVDAPPDPISTWGSGGGAFTWATNYSQEAISGQLALTSTYTLQAISGTITGTCNNIAVVIVTDDATLSVDDSLYITNVKLEYGGLTEYFSKDLWEQLFDAQLYYDKSYDLDINPGTSTSDGMIACGDTGLASAVHTTRCMVYFKRTMFKKPTMLGWTNSGTAGSWHVEGGVTTGTFTTPVSGRNNVEVEVTSTTSTDGRIWGHFTADAEFAGN